MVVANVDLPVGCAVLDPVWRALVVALVMAVLSPVMAGRALREVIRMSGVLLALKRLCERLTLLLFIPCWASDSPIGSDAGKEACLYMREFYSETNGI